MSTSDSSYLIVGLGNPGDKYKLNRHNIGFTAVDFLAHHWRLSSSWNKEHQAQVLKAQFDANKIILAKPQTFMNLSGESVQPLMAYYKVPIENLLVIHDDLDIPFATLKLITNRGHGGQNGIRNIHEKIGPAYARLKCGVGRPPHPDWSVADWVLSNWSNQEFDVLNSWLENIESAVKLWMKLGYSKAANTINSSPSKPKES